MATGSNMVGFDLSISNRLLLAMYVGDAVNFSNFMNVLVAPLPSTIGCSGIGGSCLRE